MELKEPLLGCNNTRQTTPLWSLYTVTFLKTVAYATAVLPACAIRSYNLTRASGGHVHEAALAIGLMMSLRYVTEFVSSLVLVRFSNTMGSRSLLLVSASAIVMETALMALVSSPLSLGVVHVMGGLGFSAGAIENQYVKENVKKHTKSGALERLAAAIGAGFLVGPILGGMLVRMYGDIAPFIGGHTAGCAAVMVAVFWLPDDKKVQRRAPKVVKRRLPACGASSGAHRQASVESNFGTRRISCESAIGEGITAKTAKHDRTNLVWYCCALVFSTLGMAAYGASSTMWMQLQLSWSVEKVGDFMAIGACTQLVAQGVLMPMLVEGVGGRAVLASQISLVCNAARFLAFASDADGTWAYMILGITSPGFCSTPLLSGLCLLHIPKRRHTLWSFGLPAVNTVASALGALVGSYMLAGALRETCSPGAPLLFSAAANCLACACLAHVKVGSARMVDKLSMVEP